MSAERYIDLFICVLRAFTNSALSRCISTSIVFLVGNYAKSTQNVYTLIDLEIALSRAVVKPSVNSGI